MHRYRAPLTFVLCVLVVLLVIVLTTPSGATQAKWLSQASTDLPGATVGAVSFDVAGDRAPVRGAGAHGATLTNGSAFGLAYRPVQVSVLGPAGEEVAVPAGTRFTYRPGCTGPAPAVSWAADGAGQRLAAVTAGGAQPSAPLHRAGTAGLCLTVSTDARAEAALRPLDGQELRIRTAVEGVPVGGGSRTALREWSARWTVDVPDAPPSSLTVTCESPQNRAWLRWSGSGTSAAVARWDVAVRRAGTAEGWSTPLGPPREATGVEVTPSSLGVSANARYEVRVRGVLADGTVAAEGSLPSGLRVTGNAVHCGGAN